MTELPCLLYWGANGGSALERESLQLSDKACNTLTITTQRQGLQYTLILLSVESSKNTHLLQLINTLSLLLWQNLSFRTNLSLVIWRKQCLCTTVVIWVIFWWRFCVCVCVYVFVYVCQCMSVCRSESWDLKHPMIGCLCPDDIWYGGNMLYWMYRQSR